MVGVEVVPLQQQLVFGVEAGALLRLNQRFLMLDDLPGGDACLERKLVLRGGIV
jgi:hypothetical protein